MKLKEFYKLKELEEYLEFFGIEYDERLVNTKRLHILKSFAEMVKKINGIEDEEKLLELYKFALLAAYKNFEAGFSPSAADVWNMFERKSGCLACLSSLCEINGCNSFKEVA